MALASCASFGEFSFVVSVDFSCRLSVVLRSFLTMANETRPLGCEATKTADHQIYKIHNSDDFIRITKGIKVARCMQSPSSYGEPRTRFCECLMKMCLFISLSRSAPLLKWDGDGCSDWEQKVIERDLEQIDHIRDAWQDPKDTEQAYILEYNCFSRMLECEISMLLLGHSKAWRKWCAYWSVT